MADLSWLTVRVIDDLLAPDGPKQTVEVLDGDEVVGQLCAVSRAETVLEVNSIGKLRLTLDCSSESVSFGPFGGRRA